MPLAATLSTLYGDLYPSPEATSSLGVSFMAPSVYVGREYVVSGFKPSEEERHLGYVATFSIRPSDRENEMIQVYETSRGSELYWLKEGDLRLMHPPEEARAMFLVGELLANLKEGDRCTTR